MSLRTYKTSYLASAIALSLSMSANTFAADEAEEPTDKEIEKIEVRGSLGSLPGQAVESVFGFGKSILETPRSASTISQEQMERFSVSDIDELVAFAPGTFTQSFFGVAGSLDVRGTPGETYFRGVKRLDNPGNYPTPIGASSRVDIVRGPASPIYGPAKIGGYLNFNPKSARASGGQYLDDNTGGFSYTTGSWNKNVITAEIGGPAEIAGKKAGFYIYGEVERSDSFYENTKTDQTVLQAAFNIDVTDNLRFEFGGMYHDYDGNQVAGWNRLTQDLVDNGTYITGTAQPLDTDGDGYISHQEYNAAGVDQYIWQVPMNGTTPDLIPDIMALENVGTTTLDASQVLVAEDDELTNTVQTLYFDAMYYTDNGWEVKNQLFYEGYENNNENAYGFSQYHDSWVIEDKIVFSTELELDDMIAQVQISPSLRYVDFEHGEDWKNEYFDRRDLTMESSSLDRRLLATVIDDDYTEWYEGNYLDLGFAAMVDLTWEWGLNVVLGARYDSFDMESSTDPDKLLLGNYGSGFVIMSDDGKYILNDFGADSANYTAADITAPVEAEDTVDGVSWNTSISYKFDMGLIPYITAAEQSTIIVGQGAEIKTGSIYSGGVFDKSTLMEFGVKGTFLEDSLYFALSNYTQERTDTKAQSTTLNNVTETKGTEFELRWVVTDDLVVSAGYTDVKVLNLTAIEDGGQYGFFGAEDMPLVEPSLAYGGVVGGTNPTSNNPEGLKAGIPQNIYSFTASYDFQNGFSANASVIDVDSTYSGYSQAVLLPSYTLVNAGVLYQADTWSASLNVKNLTDETYYRANFPDLFGSAVVLPELPRSVQAKFTYNF
ncbi:TonB-dependent receptor plug domain-containing protein [uncultured Psychrosphaera sp.]|uniref:TonB-dependent siderophore receptor n=1 Tax=uncultured Psychrosphaera sp. TaxID=1403522 RepID=UPI00262C6997|nr:TonB-dependent receptor plug domain-containing protein [uncultured Psychrosphaera sp.]